MFAIYMKKINQQSALPVMFSSQTLDVSKARKYRSMNKAVQDFERCCKNYPNFLWQIRDIKTQIVHYTNSQSVLHVWNKQLGRENLKKRVS